jgi:hypothetical protein
MKVFAVALKSPARPAISPDESHAANPLSPPLIDGLTPIGVGIGRFDVMLFRPA